MKAQISLRSFYLEGEIENGALKVLRSEGDMSIKGYYTTKEAAEILGVTQGRVKQLVADGVLESVLVGRTRLIPVAAVEARRIAKPPAGRPRKIRGKKRGKS